MGLAHVPPLGYSARVHLARLGRVLTDEPPVFLGAVERERWTRFPSAKRRLEFAAGRLACKLAARAARAAHGLPPVALEEILILPRGCGEPWVFAPGRAPERVALSHAAGVAFAICTVGPSWVGVDVVARDQHLAFDPHLFHASEADSPHVAVDRMISFALKEATVKALGQGMGAVFKEIRTWGEAGQRWIGIPPALSTQAEFQSYTLLHTAGRTTCVALVQDIKICSSPYN